MRKPRKLNNCPLMKNTERWGLNTSKELKCLNYVRRAEFEPTDKYKTPVTSTHSHGFKLKDPN